MPQIIVNCLGGLGNQMTQYAFYEELWFRGYDVKLYIGNFDTYGLHNNYELDKVFKVKIDYATKDEVERYFTFLKKVLRKFRLYNSGLVLQKHFEYYEPYLQHVKDSYLIGYWQSEKYFAHIKDDLRKTFIFPDLIGYNLELMQKMSETNSISIHVRRGDYVGHELYDNICNLDYYKKAIQYIQTNVDNAKFFVFSNDIEWCKANIGINDAIYVTGNTGCDSYRDMQLTSLCKHNIIANSSFSWWGAWLNNNPNKLVLVPHKFFNGDVYNESDIYPTSWIKI